MNNKGIFMYSIHTNREPAANSSDKQMFIQEKNSTLMVPFTLTNDTTVGDISAIVANTLNCNSEISIQLFETRLPTGMRVAVFKEDAIKELTYSVMHAVNSCAKQVFIQEKNTPSGLLLTLTPHTTIGEISAIVAKALNCNKEIAIHMFEARLPNEINLAAFNEDAIKKITYSRTNIEHRYPTPVTNTSTMSTCVYWNIYQPAKESGEIQFRTEHNSWNFSWNNPTPENFIGPNIASTSITNLAAEPIIDSLTSLTLATPTVIPAMPDSEKLEEEKYRKNIKTYFDSQYKLYTIEKNGTKEYLTTLGVAKTLENETGEINISSPSWAAYLGKGHKYNLFRIYQRGEPTYGDLAIAVGSAFRVRVGKISKAKAGEEVNLPLGNDRQFTYNIPFPESFHRRFPGMFDDKIVVQYNQSKKVGYSSDPGQSI